MSRLLTAKQQEAREPKQKRPYLATEVHDVVEADKWRQQILREIGRKVMEIQNAGLGDHRCHSASRHTEGTSISTKHAVSRALCLCVALYCCRSAFAHQATSHVPARQSPTQTTGLICNTTCKSLAKQI